MAIMHRELLNIYDSWQFHLRSVPFLCNADEHADHVCQDACSKATHQMRHNRETGELGALQVIEHRNVRREETAPAKADCRENRNVLGTTPS